MGRDTLEMTKHEYEFMSGQWEGPKGAAYNQTYEFCREFDWIMGFSAHGKPIPTQAGIDAMEEFKKSS